jgi:hypothetical protein
VNPAEPISSDSRSGVYRFIPSIILWYFIDCLSSPSDSLVTANSPPGLTTLKTCLKVSPMSGQK